MDKDTVLNCLMESIKMAMRGDCNIAINVWDGNVDISYDIGKEIEIDESENTGALPSKAEKEGD